MKIPNTTNTPVLQPCFSTVLNMSDSLSLHLSRGSNDNHHETTCSSLFTDKERQLFAVMSLQLPFATASGHLSATPERAGDARRVPLRREGEEAGAREGVRPRRHNGGPATSWPPPTPRTRRREPRLAHDVALAAPSGPHAPAGGLSGHGGGSRKQRSRRSGESWSPSVRRGRTPVYLEE